jgi:surfeit locus 1 family protein
LKIKSKLSSKRIKEPWAFLKTLLALILVALCLVAANWQYERGVARHAKNFDIEANTAKPTISLEELLETENLKDNEWRTISIQGSFLKQNEVLLRNRYNSEGKYGYQYLTLFQSLDKQFWIDRGWVKAGATALERPALPVTPSEEIEIIGRVRLDSSLPRGSFFALPAAGNLISSWNLKSKVETEDFYIDLISGEGVTPDTPAELPELSDGPHMAYALQWIFFAGLIIYARILIRRR